MTRRLVDVAQDVIINEVDCKTEEGLTIRAIIEGGEVLTPLSERILGRSAAEDIKHPETNKVIVKAGQLIHELDAEAVEEAGVDSVKIRSVLTCETHQGLCASCYGRDLARGTVVNQGEAVGVIAAQSIGEPGTQLTMRTFHIGGAAQRGAEKSSVEAALDGKVTIKNNNTVTNSEGENIVMGRFCEVAIKDAKGRERARYRVPYGSKIHVKDGAKVKKGDKIANWDPYTTPIITEREGTANFVDLIEGTSMREVLDESTGISSRVVMDWRQQARGGTLKPRITLRDKKGDPIKLASGMEARYFMPVDAILNVENGAQIKPGDVLARIPRESSKTKDIIGGLPRVAELFEARKPKDHAIISEIAGRVEFGKDYKNKRRVVICPVDDESAESVEYLVPRGKHIVVFEGDIVEKGDVLVEGSLVPHEILRIQGVEALAHYLVNEVQEVYRLQGVPINDKHIEVIVSQMLQKVEVTNPGDTTLLVGEQIDRIDFEEINEKALKDNRKPAEATAVLQGITKASLHTRSFLSAASFQQTTSVLTEASISGKKDMLEGLKENIIVGRLIPAGTGGAVRRIKKIAAGMDAEVIAARADEEAPAAIASEAVPAEETKPAESAPEA